MGNVQKQRISKDLALAPFAFQFNQPNGFKVISISLKFSTTQSRVVTIKEINELRAVIGLLKSSAGYTGMLTALSIVDESGYTIAAGNSILVECAQTAGACVLDLEIEYDNDLDTDLTASGKFIIDGAEVLGTVSATITPPVGGFATETTLEKIATSSSGNDSVQTTVAGTTFQVLNTQAAKRVIIANITGTDIEVQQGGAGVAFPIPDGSIQTFDGLTNANNLAIRRIDQAITQVTVKYRWEN